MQNIKRVCVVGTGVIGAGWASRFLANGLDVIATDPHPEAEVRLRASIDNAWPSLERIGLAPGADRGRRLDHVWVTPGLKKQLTGAQVFAEARGWERPSDHAPVAVDIDI